MEKTAGKIGLFVVLSYTFSQSRTDSLYVPATAKSQMNGNPCITIYR
jgi:hypothetical protein